MNANQKGKWELETSRLPTYYTRGQLPHPTTTITTHPWSSSLLQI
jgi:hypothetical protein